MATPPPGFNPYYILQRLLLAKSAVADGRESNAQMQVRASLDDLECVLRDGFGGQGQDNLSAYKQLRDLLVNDPLKNMDEVQEAAIRAMPRICVTAVDMTGLFDPDYTRVSGKVHVVYAVDLSVSDHAAVAAEAVDLFCAEEVGDDILDALKTEMNFSENIRFQSFSLADIQSAGPTHLHEAPEIPLDDLLDAEDYQGVVSQYVDAHRANPTLFDLSYSPYQAMRSIRADIERGLDGSALQRLQAERPAHYGTEVFGKAFAEAAALVHKGDAQGALAVLDSDVISKEIDSQRLEALNPGKNSIESEPSMSPSR